MGLFTQSPVLRGETSPNFRLFKWISVPFVKDTKEDQSPILTLQNRPFSPFLIVKWVQEIHIPR